MSRIDPVRLDAYKLLHDGALAFARAEQAGIRVDVEYCKRKQRRVGLQIDQLHQEFTESNFYKHWKKVYGKNLDLNSDAQLAHLLYDIRKLEPAKLTAGGRGAVDQQSLLQLNIPALETYIEMGKLTKIRDSVLDGFIRETVNGFMHPFFNLHLVNTFRSSSDHPNFQNIPKRDYESMLICRRAIFPRLGHLLMEADFSGIEVRVGEAYHLDPVMKKYITDPTTDMHRDMAMQIFKLKRWRADVAGYKNILRQAAKNGFVFPQFYGDYYRSCAANIACHWGKLNPGEWKPGQGVEIEKGITISDLLMEAGFKSFNEFVDHVKKIEDDFWNRRFKVYQKWKDQWWAEYQDKGYFDTLTGFRCSGLMDKKQVSNYPVQGSAFHCLLWCFIRIDEIAREEGWDSRLIGQIHDSMLLDIIPEELKHVAKTIKHVTEVEMPRHFKWINVPMEIEMEICPVDRPWNEKEEYKLAA